ncbi:MAG: DEAD/DEAH box helicase, partial [Proteobacteria bacterium]|nr:DEAD/DEAH box helicase [Pseudomonadota bacterium]
MQHYHPKKRVSKKFHKRPRRTEHPKRMKPEAEAVLHDIFSRIGRPPSAPFTPDPFQLKALKSIKRTDCLVMAPTGAGKTWIAEEAISHTFERGGRCWYASPLKALTNSKWVEFGHRFGSMNVGILTGDTKENVNAPIIVGTTEILRNQLYDVMHRGEDLNCDLVILDEAHFLGDEDRGVVWEEVMIYLPARVNLLMLSATVGNGYEISAWLSSVRGKECVVIKEEKRPVPLYPLFLHPSGKIKPYLDRKKLYGKVRRFMEDELSRSYRRSRKLPPFGEIIRVLARFKLLPAIFFLKSRSECDAAVDTCGPSSKHYEETSFNDELYHLLDRFPYMKNHKQLHNLRFSRVGAHHGGQLPPWKFLIETMMKKGHLDAIFATTTVAAGVNFPARTIVLFNSDQFNGREFVPLNGTEFHQMTGRAGRRGQDKIGFMLAVPGRFMDIKHIKNLLFTKPEVIESQIRSDFSMVLNLLLSHTPEDIRNIFEKSLAAYQQTKHKKAELNLWNDFQKHLAFLKAEGFVDEEDRLTGDGIWASRLRLDQPLLIAECLRNDAFPKYDERLLAAVIAPFVYDGDQEMKIYKKKVPRKLTAAYDKMVSTVAPISERMLEAGFGVNPLKFWTSLILYDWTQGAPWNEIIEKREIADGDMAMLVSRTADNLRQITSLKETHPDIAALAEKAREAIL